MFSHWSTCKQIRMFGRLLQEPWLLQRSPNCILCWFGLTWGQMAPDGVRMVRSGAGLCHDAQPLPLLTHTLPVYRTTHTYHACAVVCRSSYSRSVGWIDDVLRAALLCEPHVELSRIGLPCSLRCWRLLSMRPDYDCTCFQFYCLFFWNGDADMCRLM